MFSKVSVIIPYYNDGKYIAETLASVEQQTYPAIETILVDDGSTDENSIRVFDTIQIKKGRKLHEENAGPSAARNLGIVLSTGKYILPLDADDKIDPTYIEKAVTILENNPQCGIVYCEAKFFGADSGKWHLPPFTMGRMLLSNIIFNAGLFRKEDWEICGGYDESLRIGIEDWDFWLKILELGRTAYQIPETLFYYRIKSTSRNRMFIMQEDKVRETYLAIQNKHKALYMKFFDDYLAISREHMLNQDLALQKQIKARFGNTFPVLRKLWHKWKNA